MRCTKKCGFSYKIAMENKVYNDEKIVDEFTAHRLATAYSAMMTALGTNNAGVQENEQTLPSTNQLLGEILVEVRAIRAEIACNKKIRLGI